MARNMKADFLSDAEVEPFVSQHDVASADESEDDILRDFVEKIAELESRLPAVKELVHNSMQSRSLAASENHTGGLRGVSGVVERQHLDVTAPA